MSSAWGAPPAVPAYSDAPYGRSPSGRPYKFPPAGWVPGPVGDPQPAPPPRKMRSLWWLWRTRINGASLVGVSAYPPGPLGGSLRCGELTKRAPGTLCAWADHGAVVLVFVQHWKPDQAAALVVRMRADIEHRRA